MHTHLKYIVFLLFFHSLLCFLSCTSSHIVLGKAEVPQADQQNTVEKTAKKLTVLYEESAQTVEGKQPVDELAQYTALFENIQLKAENTPAETKNGSAFASDFSVLLTDKQGNSVQAVVLTVKYPSGRINDKILFATEDLSSDENGIVSFSSPIPEFSCNAELLFYPASDMQNQEVLQYAERQALRMPYKVHTDKTNKVLSISILDYTESGKAITTNSLSSSALLRALYKKGFRSVGNSDFINEIHSANTKLLYKNASTLFKNKINYLIFGTVKYENPVVKNEDGLYETTLKAELSIMDMHTSDIVLQTSQSFSAKEKNEWQLLDSIRNKFLAPALAELIYYNF